MEFLDKQILDNSIRSYLIVFGTIAVVFLFKKIISKYLIDFIHLFFRNVTTLKKEALKNLIITPLSWILLVMVTVIAIDKLNFPGFWRFNIYGISTQNILKGIGRIAIILVIIRFMLKLVDYIAYSLQLRTDHFDKNDAQIINFLKSFIKVVLALFGILWLLQSGFNKDVSKFLAGLGLVGAAIALAAKESLENLIASFIIFFDKPFYVGDVLKVNDISGTVETIGLRSTRIRTAEKTLVSIPNKQMVDSVVDNLTRRTQRRGKIVLELNATSSGDSVKNFTDYCKQLLYADKEVVENFNVHIIDLSKNALTVQIEFYTIPYSLNELNEYKEVLILQLKDKMEKLGLNFSSVSDIRVISEGTNQNTKNNSQS
jgi:MscS family membrane protein